MISGHGNIDTAVKAMRIGAHDFLEKPLALNRVVVSVENALERNRLEREVRELSIRLDPERQPDRRFRADAETGERPGSSPRERRAGS